MVEDSEPKVESEVANSKDSETTRDIKPIVNYNTLEIQCQVSSMKTHSMWTLKQLLTCSQDSEQEQELG